MSQITDFIALKTLQAKGWSARNAEKLATKAINKMSIKEQAKLTLLAIRAVGVARYRPEFIAGTEKEFADEVAKNPEIKVSDLTDKYFKEQRYLEVLAKLCLTQHDIKSLAIKAGAKE